MNVNGDIYTASKNFTLPPAVTAVTNLTSAALYLYFKFCKFVHIRKIWHPDNTF